MKAYEVNSRSKSAKKMKKMEKLHKELMKPPVSDDEPSETDYVFSPGKRVPVYHLDMPASPIKEEIDPWTKEKRNPLNECECCRAITLRDLSLEEVEEAIIACDSYRNGMKVIRNVIKYSPSVICLQKFVRKYIRAMRLLHMVYKPCASHHYRLKIEVQKGLGQSQRVERILDNLTHSEYMPYCDDGQVVCSSTENTPTKLPSEICSSVDLQTDHSYSTSRRSPVVVRINGHQILDYNGHKVCVPETKVHLFKEACSAGKNLDNPSLEIEKDDGLSFKRLEKTVLRSEGDQNESLDNDDKQSSNVCWVSKSPPASPSKAYRPSDLQVNYDSDYAILTLDSGVAMIPKKNSECLSQLNTLTNETLRALLAKKRDKCKVVVRRGAKASYNAIKLELYENNHLLRIVNDIEDDLRAYRREKFPHAASPNGISTSTESDASIKETYKDRTSFTDEASRDKKCLLKEARQDKRSSLDSSCRQEDDEHIMSSFAAEAIHEKNYSPKEASFNGSDVAKANDYEKDTSDEANNDEICSRELGDLTEATSKFDASPDEEGMEQNESQNEFSKQSPVNVMVASYYPGVRSLETSYNSDDNPEETVHSTNVSKNLAKEEPMLLVKSHQHKQEAGNIESASPSSSSSYSSATDVPSAPTSEVNSPSKSIEGGAVGPIPQIVVSEFEDNEVHERDDTDEDVFCDAMDDTDEKVKVITCTVM